MHSQVLAATRSHSKSWIALAIAASALFVLAFPGGAFASHIKGGTIYAEITAGGQVQGDASYYENLGGTPCTVGEPTESYSGSLDVQGPGGSSGSFSVDMPPAVCPANGNIGIFRGTFSEDLADVTGLEVAPDGEYVFSLGDCCYVGGIVNAPNADGFDVQTRVDWATGQARYAPTLAGNPRLGIPIGGNFLDALNPSVPGSSAPFAYQSVAAPLGPDTDVVTYNADGTVTIPSTSTSGMTLDDAYLYSVRVTEPATGNYSDRSVVLIAGLDDGLPPVVDPEPQQLTVAPGSVQVVGNTKVLSGGKGLSMHMMCEAKCTVVLTGQRLLKKKTGEPDQSFKRKVVVLEANQVTRVTLQFEKALRRTVRRGVLKGNSPIKFLITTQVDGQSTSHVVGIRF